MLRMTLFGDQETFVILSGAQRQSKDAGAFEARVLRGRRPNPAPRVP
jgi:hypothetical protein